ncbi:hypothetical protein EYF80_019243 [Liparis tanakae]|uniref:Uncharacterized protein n=1 Tax=Liparis tanakae TaxID=230148 RepID=A0A4Z2HXW8_9TELE|nr:hypothetical protein EYF80_019243 [Liparis tanakae]
MRSEITVTGYRYGMNGLNPDDRRLPGLRVALGYDSGLYATTCDGSCYSEVSLPEEKHDGKNLHIREALMPSCIRLDLPH